LALGFLDHMQVVPGRRDGDLHEILLATLVGVVCGPDGLGGIEEIAKGAVGRLRRFLPFASGIPTAQTLRKPARHARRGRQGVFRAGR
jgi:hypothetical protein